MINILKKLFIIYDLKPFKEKANTFLINHENNTYVFFKNFIFLGNLSSLDFFHYYIDSLKESYKLIINFYHFFFFLRGFFENFISNNICCIRKNIKFK